MSLMRSLLAVVLLVSLATGCASSEAESTTPSQRNGLIAFTRQHKSQIDQLYSIKPDGSEASTLSRAGVVALEPVWSPDGKRIAFIGGRPKGSSHLWMMNADGSGKRMVVREQDPVGSPGRPSWSPDGTRLVFVGAQISTDALYVVRADGSGLRRLAGDIGSDPAWSPDGKQIALSDTVGQLVLIDLTGKKTRTLTSDQTCAEWPTWSPDGRRIAYVASEPGCFGDTSSIHLVDADGGGMRGLTHPLDGFYDQSPAWSPDGREIVFQRGDFALGDIYVVDIESGDETKLTDSRLHQDFDPSWQPLPAA
jgi:Tol biopolymer transport system component